MNEGPYTAAENGNMPSSELVTVQGAMQLQHNVAAAWSSEVSASGGVLSISPDGAYRDAALQLQMYNAGIVGAPSGGSHGWGTCVDIYTATGNNWAIANFSSSLWKRDRWIAGNPQTAAYEYNHWHYVGTLTVGPTPSPAQEEIEMIQIKITDTANTFGGGANVMYFALVAPGFPWKPYTSAAWANNYAGYVGHPSAIPCAYDEWQYYMEMMGGTSPIG